MPASGTPPSVQQDPTVHAMQFPNGSSPVGDPIVEEMEPEEDFEQDLIDVFNLFNQNKKGKMNVTDFRTAFRVLGVELTREQLQSSQAIFSGDGKNYTQTEFLDAANEILSKRSSKDRQQSLDEAFRLADRNHGGVLTAKELSRVSLDVHKAGQIATERTEGSSDTLTAQEIQLPKDLFGGEVTEAEALQMMEDLDVEDIVTGMSKAEFTALISSSHAFL